MIVNDDRTPEERTTHRCLVVGTDRYLSGWGQASGGNSYAAWACQNRDVVYVYQWVRNRSDMKKVRIVYGDYKPNPKYCAHLHIYVVHNDFAV